MRSIDADTLLEKVEKIQPWEPYLGNYAQGIRHCMEIVSLLIKDAPTIEPSAQPEPAIPLQWIEAQIEWLKSLDNTFSTLTAVQISAMVNKWKDEQDDEQ